MVKLEPIQQEDFDRFLERAIREYAEDHVRNGNWPAEGALEKSKAEFARYLPAGMLSENQHIWSIVADDKKIGVLWVQVKEREAFIFDLILDEAFRGKGYGKQALAAMDEKLESMKVKSVGLHVFADNLIAQELYRKTGFEVTGLFMRKSYEKGDPTARSR